MRRWSYKTLVLFMFLGTLANWMLAWSFAVLGSIDNSKSAQVVVWNGEVRQTMGTDAIALTWPVNVPAEWPSPLSRHHAHGRGLRYENCAGLIRTGDTNSTVTVSFAQFGWPFYSLEWTVGSESHDGGDVRRFGGRWISLPQFIENYSLQTKIAFPAKRRFPIEPVWPGFALNSIFFGVGFWLALRSVASAQRFVRSRRGQCIACGYPVGSSPVCTECGNLIRIDQAITLQGCSDCMTGISSTHGNRSQRAIHGA